MAEGRDQSVPPVSAFEDDEDKYAFPELRRYVEQFSRSPENIGPVANTYDEYVEMMSAKQRQTHAEQIVRQLSAMLMMEECSIMDPEEGKPPVIHMKYGGRSYVMMLDNAT